MARPKGPTQATTTSLVEQAFVQADDFLHLHDVIRLTGRTTDQVTAALHSLRLYKVVDSVESGGKLYWFHTPGTDTRLRTVGERAKEEKPRRPRRIGGKLKSS